MISVLVATGIVYFGFWFICFCRGQYCTYSKFELFCFYLITRIGPAAMLQSGQISVWRNVILECAVLLLLVYYVRRQKKKALHSTIYACYLFQPFTGICILSGRIEGVCLLFLMLALLCVCDRMIKKKNGTLMQFLPEYVLAGLGVYGWFWATEILDQHLSEVVHTDQIPVLYIISVLLMIGAAAGILRKAVTGPQGRKWQMADETEDCGCQRHFRSENRMTVRDIVLMLLFTVIFAAVVLFRLGSTRVPETYEDFRVGENGENEIILSFDKGVTLSKVYIYLGYTSKRVISFSCLDEQSTDWDVFDSKRTIESAFKWNEIPVNRSLTMLGMVLMEGNARIHEIVCLDAGGNRVLPDNAGYYKNLFDEQGLFPEVRTYYDQTMFDEVYHARTAYEFLHQLPIYENTHPPLGKSIISLGIRAFGMNPFGWRIMCALFGILMIPVIYCFSHKMFGGTAGACCSTILLATAFMNYVLARIATIDIIVGLFILLMFFFMYGFVRSCSAEGKFAEQVMWLFLCGCSMACAISTKWTGCYAVVGIAVIFFTAVVQTVGGIGNVKMHSRYLRKLGFVCVICFIVIPAIVYFWSYLPFTRVYRDKGLIRTVIDNGKLMLGYHSVTVFEHPYSSEWYEWLTDCQPLLDCYTVFADGKISSIATFGNPLLLWGGLVSLVHQIYLWRCRKCKNAQFLCIAYASVVIPWLFIHRTVFIYQYFAGILLLVLMVTNSLNHLRRRKWMMIGTACLSIALFILFFPVLSGSAVDSEYVNMILEWLPTWKFALG